MTQEGLEYRQTGEDQEGVSAELLEVPGDIMHVSCDPRGDASRSVQDAINESNEWSLAADELLGDANGGDSLELVDAYDTSGEFVAEAVDLGDVGRKLPPVPAQESRTAAVPGVVVSILNESGAVLGDEPEGNSNDTRGGDDLSRAGGSDVVLSAGLIGREAVVSATKQTAVVIADDSQGRKARSLLADELLLSETEEPAPIPADEDGTDDEALEDDVSAEILMGADDIGSDDTEEDDIADQQDSSSGGGYPPEDTTAIEGGDDGSGSPKKYENSTEFDLVAAWHLRGDSDAAAELLRRNKGIIDIIVKRSGWLEEDKEDARQEIVTSILYLLRFKYDLSRYEESRPLSFAAKYAELDFRTERRDSKFPRSRSLIYMSNPAKLLARLVSSLEGRLAERSGYRLLSEEIVTGFNLTPEGAAALREFESKLIAQGHYSPFTADDVRLIFNRPDAPYQSYRSITQGMAMAVVRCLFFGRTLSLWESPIVEEENDNELMSSPRPIDERDRAFSEEESIPIDQLTVRAVLAEALSTLRPVERDLLFLQVIEDLPPRAVLERLAEMHPTEQIDNIGKLRRMYLSIVDENATGARSKAVFRRILAEAVGDEPYPNALTTITPSEAMAKRAELLMLLPELTGDARDIVTAFFGLNGRERETEEAIDERLLWGFPGYSEGIIRETLHRLVEYRELVPYLRDALLKLDTQWQPLSAEERRKWGL